MGVGVYDNDFEGYGKTFLISPFDYINEENFGKFQEDSEEEDRNLSYDDWADMEMDLRSEDIDYTLQGVIKKYNGDYVPLNQRQREDDLQIVGSIGRVDIYMRGWEDDVVIGVGVNKHLRELLIDAENMNTYMSLHVIDEYNASSDRVADINLQQMQIIHKELVNAFIENEMSPRYRTSGYTSSLYTQEGIDYPLNDNEKNKLEQIMSTEFSAKDTFEALDNHIKEYELDSVYFEVDLDERGRFNAGVRALLSDETIYYISSEDNNGKISLIEDGYMKHEEDIAGLEKYLKSNNIINQDVMLVDFDKAEEILWKGLDGYVDKEDFLSWYTEVKEDKEELEQKNSHPYPA